MSEEMNEIIDQHHPGPGHNSTNTGFSKGGYRSNEQDENDELARLTTQNAVGCHQKLIEELDLTQIKLQQLGLQSI